MIRFCIDHVRLNVCYGPIVNRNDFYPLAFGPIDSSVHAVRRPCNFFINMSVFHLRYDTRLATIDWDNL